MFQNFHIFIFISVFTTGKIVIILHLFNQKQGYNARKVISEVYASFVLQSTVCGVNVHTRHGDMETPQHGIASKKQNHKTNLMSFSLNLKLKRLYSNDFHSLSQSQRSAPSPSSSEIPPREIWFQQVRRVYTTAINCPCIRTLVLIFFILTLINYFLFFIK